LPTNGFRGFQLTSLVVGSAITGLTPNTETAGLHESRIAFGDDFLRLTLTGLTTDGFVSSTLMTATDVPEPASLAVPGGASRRADCGGGAGGCDRP